MGGYRCARGAGGFLQQPVDPESLGTFMCRITETRAQCSLELYTLGVNSLRCKKSFSRSAFSSCLPVKC